MVDHHPYRSNHPPPAKQISEPYEHDVGIVHANVYTFDNSYNERCVSFIPFTVEGHGPPEGDWITQGIKITEYISSASSVYYGLLANAFSIGFFDVPQSTISIPWHQISRFQTTKTEKKVLRWNIHSAWFAE